MKHSIVLFSALICSIGLFSNSVPDSLVRVSDLHFVSDFEKQIFSNKSNTNDLYFCLASDNSMTNEKANTFRNRFDEVL